jgi:ribonuclease-3 family protein
VGEELSSREQNTKGPAQRDFKEAVLSAFGEREKDLRSYSPLSFAFLGDAVYSLIARTVVFSEGNRQAAKMHQKTSSLYVSAKAQAKIGDAMLPYLSEEEADIYRRGLHASPEHHAKNATMEEYMKATALETLCGYLYMKEALPRFLELMQLGLRDLEKGSISS